MAISCWLRCYYVTRWRTSGTTGQTPQQCGCGPIKSFLVLRKFYGHTIRATSVRVERLSKRHNKTENDLSSGKPLWRSFAPKMCTYPIIQNALTTNPSLLYGFALASHLHMPRHANKLWRNITKCARARRKTIARPMHFLLVACEWVYGGSHIFIKVKVLHTPLRDILLAVGCNWLAHIRPAAKYTFGTKICCANAHTWHTLAYVNFSDMFVGANTTGNGKIWHFGIVECACAYLTLILLIF